MVKKPVSAPQKAPTSGDQKDRIRAAIEDDAKKPKRILTVRGSGYVFARDQDRG